MPKDFIARIIAELDMSKAEAELQKFQNKDRKVKIDVDVNNGQKIDDTGKSADRAAKSADNMGNSFKKAFAFGGAATLASRVINEIRLAADKAVKSVKEIDDAITSLRMATGGNYEQARSLISTYNEMGQQLGATTTEVASSADAWLRQGHDIQTTNKLIKDSMTLSKVANLDSAKSTEYLTSAMKGYKVAAEDVSNIVDKLTAVDLVSATDAGGLAEGMSKVANSANLAGVSMDKLLGYLAATGEVTKESMSTIGNSFKTIFARMADIKSGKLSLIDEDGTTEILSDVETVLDKAGIKLRSSENEFRNFGDVLDEVAAKWGDMSTVQQAAVSKAFAGTRQQERFKALMENYSKAQEYAEVAADSFGSAEKKFEAYSESLEAKTKSLQASFEALATDTISKDMYAGILDASKGMLDFLDKTNLVKVALTGLAVTGAVNGFTALTTGITQAAMQMQRFGEATAILKAGNLGEDAFQHLLLLTNGLSESQLKAVLSTQALTMQQRIAILTNTGMSQAEAQATLQTMGLVAAEGAATATTVTLSGAIKGLWATLMANPIVLVIAAITAVVTVAGAAIEEYEHRMDKAIEQADNARSTLDGLKSDIESLKSQIESINSKKLEITDPSEKANLEAQTQELERQLEIKQKLAEYQQKQAAEDAAKVLNTNAYQVQDGTQIQNGVEIAGFRSTNILEYTKTQQAQLKKANEDYKKLLEEQSKLEPEYKKNWWDAPTQYEQNEERLESLKNNIAFLEKSIASNVEIISTNEKSLKDENGNVIKGNESLVASCDSVLNAFTSTSSGIIEATGEAADAVEENTEEATSALSTAYDSAKAILGEVSKIQKLVSDQTTGKAIGADDIASISGYADAVEYVNGVYQLNNDRVSELIKAKIEEQKAINESNKALEQDSYIKNAAQIEALRQKIIDKNFAEGESAETIQASIDALMSENEAIKSNIAQYDLINSSLEEATSAYQHWINAQSASQSGDMFDSALKALQKIDDTLNNSDSDSYGRIGNEDYKAALGFVVPDSIDSDDEKAIKSYLKSLEKYLSLDDDDNFKGLDIEAFCKDAVEKGLMVLDGDEFKIAGQTTMQDFADGMKVSLPFVQAIFGEMQEFGGKFDWTDELEQSLGDLTVAAYEAENHLMNLKKNADLRIVLDVSQFEDSETAVKTLESNIEQMNDYKATLKADSTEYKEANDIIRYCIAQKQELQKPAVMTVDTSKATGDLGKALDLLQRFQTTNNNIEMQAAVGADTSEAEKELEKIGSKLKKVEIPAELNIDTSSTETIKNSISNLSADMIVKAGVDSSLVTAYQQADHDAKGTVKWDNNTSIVDRYKAQTQQGKGIVTWSNNTSNVKTSFEAIGRVKWINTKPKSTKTTKTTDGTHGLQGTAHAQGTAYASGNWGTAPGGKTLVAELGREIVVDPKSGRWYTVGDNGAEIVDIPRNAIVFNHLQTEALLEHGFVNGRGTALASGTAMVTGGIKVKNAEKSNNASSSKTKKSSSKTKSSSKSSKKSSKSKKKSEKSSKWSLDKFQDWLGKLFDWIEIRLDRLADTTETHLKNAEKHVKNLDFTSAADEYRAALKSTNKQIEANQQGADKYGQKAESILDKAVSKKLITQKQADSIASKVASGKINLSEYSEKIREVIKNYQEWFNKGLDCAKNVRELLDQYTEYAEALYNLPLDKLNNKLEQIGKTTKLLEANYAIADGSAAKNKILQSQNEQALQTKQANAEAATETKANLKSAKGKINQTTDSALKGLTKAQKKEIIAAVKNGEEIDWSNYSKLSLAGREAIIAYNEALKANSEAVNNSKIANAEYTKTLRENAVEMFNNIAADYSGTINRIKNESDKLNAMLDQTKAKGYKTSAEFYNSMMGWESQNISTLQGKRESLQNSLNESVANGTITEGTAAWYEMKEQIDDVDLSIIKANTSIIELGNNIRKISWDKFDDFQSGISDLIDESDFLINLLESNELFDDNGAITRAGQATQAMLAQKYNAYMRKSDEYAKEIARLDAQIANDPANVDLLERRKELVKAQRDSILAANDEKKALQDLAKDGIQKVLDKLSELISNYTDALDSAKSLKDYQRTIDEKSENISAIRKQLVAYGGDNSEESGRRIQEANKKLIDAQRDLEDTQYDRYISDTKDILGQVYDDYEKVLNERADDIDGVVRDAITAANNNAVDVQATINSACSDVGIKLSGSMNDVWGSGGVGGILSEYSADFSNKMTSLNTSVDRIGEAVERIYAASDSIANSITNTTTDSNTQSETQKQTKTEANNEPQKTVVKSTTNVSDKTTWPATVTVVGLNKAIPESTGDIADKSTWPVAVSIGGYESGVHNLKEAALAWTQEHGTESILKPSESAVLTPLKKGDSVLNAEATENLWKFANNPTRFISNRNRDYDAIIPSQNRTIVTEGGEHNYNIELNIDLPNVRNYDDFMNSARSDPKFEKLIQAMTVDRIAGRSSKEKYSVRW